MTSARCSARSPPHPPPGVFSPTSVLPQLAALREGRATARDIAWLQAVDTRDGIPASRAGGCDLPCLVLDLDATLVTCHSEKEQAVAAYKRGFGYHPLLCFLHHIRALPDRVWHPALEQDGSLRDGAEAAELTGMIDLTGYPDGTRVIVRRERPHPGARLSLFDFDEGMRHLVFLTDSPVTGGGTAQRLEARYRAHARVEERIRLLVWTQALLLDGELATAEPKKLRYRLLHAAARITRGGRRLCLRISATWRWRHELTSTFTRLAALPRPAT